MDHPQEMSGRRPGPPNPNPPTKHSVQLKISTEENAQKPKKLSKAIHMGGHRFNEKNWTKKHINYACVFNRGTSKNGKENENTRCSVTLKIDFNGKLVEELGKHGHKCVIVNLILNKENIPPLAGTHDHTEYMKWRTK